MEFQTALTNVIITLLYILPGYISAKCRIVKPEHLSSMSSVLVYVCAPCMIVHAFLNTDFSGENIGNMGLFFVITFALQVLFMLVIYALFKKKYDDAKYRILTIASVMGNVGFFGLPIIRALMPDNPEVSCYSSVYIISMNILVFTVGVYCLTREKKYMSLRAAVLNPSVIALLNSTARRTAAPFLFGGAICPRRAHERSKPAQQHDNAALHDNTRCAPFNGQVSVVVFKAVCLYHLSRKAGRFPAVLLSYGGIPAASLLVQSIGTHPFGSTLRVGHSQHG